MFDFNGDGKIDLAESFLAFSLYEALTEDEVLPVRRHKKKDGLLRRAYEKMQDNSYKNTTFGRAMLELLTAATAFILSRLIELEVLTGVASKVGGVIGIICALICLISVVLGLIL